MTGVADEGNDWATLDDLLGVEAVEVPDEGIGPVAFYGRCSTEDNQDPETSLGWQLGNACKFVEPLGGKVVVEFFDVGQSRSVPWERRDEGRRLLADLKNPDRGWDALVVGEGTRCWFGNQFSLIAPKFAAYGVDLWVPELGGKFDNRNPSHKMLMSVLGGMSESERQHVQARVRAAMDAQVVNEGRHQGGRAPYGYVVIDGGTHPNPRKAAEGYRLRVLAIEDASADVVRRIFAEYLEGSGDRAIAELLNREGIPCPSARRPDQNRHRLADGWQHTSVRAILENPRYTGYAIFGRWTKHEVLLDPDDVAAGHVVRFRKSPKERIVRSRTPAHPAIVTVKEFTEAQLRRRARSAGGMRAMAQLDRGRNTNAAGRIYLLRGLVRCGLCDRKMIASPIRDGVYYRCRAREIVPGSPLLEGHPRTVNLREDLLIEPLNAWIAGLFGPSNRSRTIEAMLGSQEVTPAELRRERVKQRLAQAEAKLNRHQRAIEAGVDPAALVDAMNGAQADRASARAELNAIAETREVSAADLENMIDSLGDIAAVLNEGEPEDQMLLYRSLNLQMRYLVDERAVLVTSEPRVLSACVRGGT
jgi:DNA invertase Pin-like site-specific DNA recombinase